MMVDVVVDNICFYLGSDALALREFLHTKSPDVLGKIETAVQNKDKVDVIRKQIIKSMTK